MIHVSIPSRQKSIEEINEDRGEKKPISGERDIIVPRNRRTHPRGEEKTK